MKHILHFKKFLNEDILDTPKNYGESQKQYKGFNIINHGKHFEIKGYSSDSGIFFQDVNTNNLEDVKKVIDLALDKNNYDKVKSIFPSDYYDIHKRIVYFSVRFKDENDTTSDIIPNSKNKYLIALPSFRGSKGFNHPSILVSAKDEDDAKDIVRHLINPNTNIGDIKKVDY